MANRIGELTFTREDQTHNDRQVKQWEGKLLLALGTAYCIMCDAYKSPYSAQYQFIVDNKDKVESTLGLGFVEDYTQAYSYLRLGINIYNVDSGRLNGYVERLNTAMNSDDYTKPKINSISRKIKYALACIIKKASLNPLTCETEILDNLIHCYITKDSNISKYSRCWKNIIY